MTTIDIHPHIISGDATRYPLAPLGGHQSDWSRTRPVSVEQLVAAMDETGVQKAAILLMQVGNDLVLLYAFSVVFGLYILIDWLKIESSYSEEALTSSREGELEAMTEKHQI